MALLQSSASQHKSINTIAVTYLWRESRAKYRHLLSRRTPLLLRAYLVFASRWRILSSHRLGKRILAVLADMHYETVETQF